MWVGYYGVLCVSLVLFCGFPEKPLSRRHTSVDLGEKTGWCVFCVCVCVVFHVLCAYVCLFMVCVRSMRGCLGDMWCLGLVML